MITIVFGKPGAGKSTTIAFVVQENKKKKDKYYKRIGKSRLYKALDKEDAVKLKKKLKAFLYPKRFYDVVYCTDEYMNDTYTITYEDLGKWQPTWNSLIILEEAGVWLSNRDFKKISKESIRMAAIHRHCGADVLIISQSTDVDKKWRDRAERLFIASKVFGLTFLRRVLYHVDVNEETHQLEDAYFKHRPLGYIFALMTCKLPFFKHTKNKIMLANSCFIRRKPYYKYFDSYEDDTSYYTMLAPDKLEEEEIAKKAIEASRPENKTRELIENGLL